MDDTVISKALEQKYILQGSLLEFTRTFYTLRTNRLFKLSDPGGRESHFLTICRALVNVIRGKTRRLIINVPPRYGKTELLIHFVAWAMSQWPDSNFLYVSYSHSLAKKQTQTIREIMMLPHFAKLFGVQLKEDATAKDNFETTRGGSVYAAGAGGTITGRGAGIQGVDRFGGAIVIDDIHKPDEVTSDVMREGVIEWYGNTMMSRTNSPDTPIIFIGQRLHEADLPAMLIEDGSWTIVSLPALDEAGNALHPTMHDKIALRKMQNDQPYVYAAQYQQNPQPAGGGIFKPEWFPLLEYEPDIQLTFITVDSAETDKDYNDATVFSLWGLYLIKHGEIATGEYGLHWMDCIELRVEPKDLQAEFMQFYSQAMNYRVKPRSIIIEKKSTGTTLASTLSTLQGMHVMAIDRTKASGNKIARFLEMQPYVAKRYISLPKYGNHTPMCLEHMRKITANNTHRFDDICDTAYDATKVGLIDKTMRNFVSSSPESDAIIQQFARKFSREQSIRKSMYGDAGC